ncbi:MAG TPA: MFS transporter [Gemmatimonadaceae bacterium]|nr:MFS transporter [Gemmatimonadaceae bacterium]
MLFLLALAELLGMSLWFTASALAPQLRILWHLSVSQGAWLTTIVQLGFVAGTALAAVLNLADVFPARWYFASAALAGAVANGLLLLAPGYRTALLLRFLTGMCLAGVYPPAMKMISTWFHARRGLAIGTIVGALTVGKATPYLVHALEGAGVAPVILAASIGAAVAGILAATSYRDGPYPFARRSFSWALVHTVVREREWRLATSGYLGHMWELYSFWTWIAAFFAASAAARAEMGHAVPSARAVGLLAFGAIAVGGVACVIGGWLADRIGHERLVNRAMALSGSCALVIGFTFGGRFQLLVPLAWLWGMAVIADSAQFSTLVTRSVPSHAVGTALTLQTSLGFLLTMVTIQIIPPAVRLVGWRFAFAVLAVGPALGIIAIRRLRAWRIASSPSAPQEAVSLP